MSDANQPQAAVPPLVGQLVHDFAQKGLALAASALVTHGLASGVQAAALEQDALGLVMLAVSIGWTWAANRARQQKFRALLAASPQKP